MLFRVQLTAITAGAIGFVFILGWALYWGANQAAINFQRYQAAYEAFERYERLSQQAYRYFKQRMDRLAGGGTVADAGTAFARQRLNAAMDALRSSAVNTPRAVDLARGELERVARLTAFLEASDYRFDEVESLHRQGRLDQAAQALSQFSEEAIDQQFQPLIDAAIATEREQARFIQVRLETLIKRSRWLALMVAVAAVAFSLAGGAALLRRLTHAIQTLMRGTNAIAAGRLGYRIDLAMGDEFGYLARQFNEMASQLEVQRNQLHERHEALEERVAERTAELNQRNADLQRMDAERLAFLADISHELRTPITVIRGEAEVALRSRTKQLGVYREALERVAELSIQLGVYVNDLLQQARAVQTSVPAARALLNLTELIAKAYEDLQMLARENALSVDLETTASPLWVMGDELRLRQALFILSDNACRYSRPGGRVTVSLRVDGQFAKLVLRDQGIGILQSDLTRIFDRHFRGQNARHYCAEGQGLGLAMAKAITEQQGGSITVSSRQNEGSTFIVRLPLTTLPDLAPADESLPAESPQR
jgi:two-component system, OmpR family, sensor kinase